MPAEKRDTALRRSVSLPFEDNMILIALKYQCLHQVALILLFYQITFIALFARNIMIMHRIQSLLIHMEDVTVLVDYRLDS